MSLLSHVSPPGAGDALASLVAGLLSDTKHAPPPDLLAAANLPAGVDVPGGVDVLAAGQESAPESREAARELAEAGAATRFLAGGPTGLGTSAARIAALRPAAPGAAAPAVGAPDAPASELTAARTATAEPATAESAHTESAIAESAIAESARARATAEPAASTPAASPLAPSSSADDGDLPELFCPGPVRDDPALGDEVNERLIEWAEQVGIYPGQLDRLRSCEFGRLIMLTHPATDDPDRLLAATKCVVAEWAADDYYVDEVSLGADPRIVGSRMAKLHAIVDPPQLPLKYAPHLEQHRREEPIAKAFRSAMTHLAQYVSATQMARFQHQMGILFTAWNQEADWHVNGRTPPVWEYLVQRHLNSYLPPMILIDSVAGYELPPEEYYDPRARGAFTLAGAANVLLNDLHSASFESDTDFNLPRVIAVEEKCTPREAIKRTVEIHNELMHMFVAEASGLSLAGSPTLRRFFVDTWAWLGGSREWHSSTGRYRD